jgi:hypothetical protein
MIRDNDYIPWRHGPDAAPWLDTLIVRDPAHARVFFEPCSSHAAVVEGVQDCLLEEKELILSARIIFVGECCFLLPLCVALLVPLLSYWMFCLQQCLYSL